MKNIYKVNEEAVKKIAERVYDNVSTVINRNDLEEMFPELESEGERIELLNYLYDVHDDDEERARWIAWLEKQGKQKKFRDSIQVGDKVTRNEEGVLVNLSQLNRVAKKDEKQGKQKHTDKVKPQFEIGDWICHTLYKKPLQITEDLGEGDYRTYPNSIVTAVELKEGTFRRWTINDAKDGDVLCTYECGKPKIVFILKGAPEKPYVLGYHCFYNIMYPHFEFDSEKGCLAPNEEDVKPATKEQRGILIKAMADAGYAFDFEKKELKKVEQKPSWSESDSRMFQNAIFYVEFYRTEKADTAQAEATISWLKSLKDRIGCEAKYITTKEWSEEDEYCIHQLIVFCENCMIPDSGAKRCANWLKNKLKSLRPQMQWKAVDKEIYVKEPALAQRKDKSEPNHGYVICYDHTLTPDVYERFIMISDIYNQSHWKPSEAQIMALEKVTYYSAFPDAKYCVDLKSLLEQLKAL